MLLAKSFLNSHQWTECFSAA